MKTCHKIYEEINLEEEKFIQDTGTLNIWTIIGQWPYGSVIYSPTIGHKITVFGIKLIPI